MKEKFVSKDVEDGEGFRVLPLLPLRHFQRSRNLRYEKK